MRNDMELQRDVSNALKWEPITKEAEIAVSAKNGVVTLGGTVRSYPIKCAAERAAERVVGVCGVADDIDVQLPNPSRRSDTLLAHQAVNALRWIALVPDEKVQVRIGDGWLTLEGEVEWEYQRRAAARAVQNLTGVRGVTNLIALKPKASASEVLQRIEDALRRHAELESRDIEVDALDGAVTLRGTVHSWAERREAEYAAWGAPGVTRVDDRLAVML